MTSDRDIVIPREVRYLLFVGNYPTACPASA